MHGIAETVGNSSVSFIILVHIPSQNICIRYIPKLNLDMSNIIRGVSLRLIHENRRNVPVVRITQFMVQKAHPISNLGVECINPGTACM